MTELNNNKTSLQAVSSKIHILQDELRYLKHQTGRIAQEITELKIEQSLLTKKVSEGKML